MAKKISSKGNGKPPQLKVLVQAWHWENKKKKVEDFEIVDDDEKALDFIRRKLKERRCMRIAVVPYERNWF